MPIRATSLNLKRPSFRRSRSFLFSLKLDEFTSSWPFQGQILDRRQSLLIQFIISRSGGRAITLLRRLSRKLLAFEVKLSLFLPWMQEARTSKTSSLVNVVGTFYSINSDHHDHWNNGLAFVAFANFSLLPTFRLLEKCIQWFIYGRSCHATEIWLMMWMGTPKISQIINTIEKEAHLQEISDWIEN